ncbi:MAG TPA: hypothetical protein PKA77_15460 [Chitinophagaceae bacterium]|nr:hypothetical protein [Chitinophagaceae bacterium]HMU59572.1 hypothetical protein [Chitinophagaceae bacterium]
MKKQHSIEEIEPSLQNPEGSSECDTLPIEEPLTIHSLRSCKGYEQLNDEQAGAIVKSLKTFAELLLLAAHKKTTLIDNQHVVYLEEQKKAAG